MGVVKLLALRDYWPKRSLGVILWFDAKKHLKICKISIYLIMKLLIKEKIFYKIEGLTKKINQ